MAQRQPKLPQPAELPEGKGRLTKGWRRRQLIHELARKELTRADLARKYGVTRSAISQFARYHKTELAAVEQQIEDEFAGLWVASKVNRVAEYQQIIDDLTERGEQMAAALAELAAAAADPTTDEDTWKRLAGRAELLADDGPAWARVHQAALKAVAEEMGQLPARVQLSVDSTVTHVVVEGVDMTKLGAATDET